MFHIKCLFNVIISKTTARYNSSYESNWYSKMVRNKINFMELKQVTALDQWIEVYSKDSKDILNELTIAPLNLFC